MSMPNDRPTQPEPFWAQQPQEEFQALAAAGIIVLLGTLILMNLIAIYLRNRFSRRW